MRLTSKLAGLVAVTVTALWPVGSAHAVSCEDLRASIEAKVRSKGVRDFSVATVEADALASGQVVGTCERGAKKLVYTQHGSQARTAAQPRPTAAPASSARPNMITECADGRVITEGSCRR